MKWEKQRTENGGERYRREGGRKANSLKSSRNVNVITMITDAKNKNKNMQNA